MKITVICATPKRELSSTYQLARCAAERLCGEDPPTYFFLPRDFSHFCCGCMRCFHGSPMDCPAYETLRPIRSALNECDLLIFAAPVYVYHVPGQLKCLLDHFGCEWLVHKPNGAMFGKQALVITTAAGAGMNSTCKDITDSLDYWGVGRVYTYRKAVRAADWAGIPTPKQEQMKAHIERIADRILKDQMRFTPRLKVKFLFYACRLMHKYLRINPTDITYWETQGWLANKRPW